MRAHPRVAVSSEDGEGRADRHSDMAGGGSRRRPAARRFDPAHLVAGQHEELLGLPSATAQEQVALCLRAMLIDVPPEHDVAVSTVGCRPDPSQRVPRPSSGNASDGVGLHETSQ